MSFYVFLCLSVSCQWVFLVWPLLSGVQNSHIPLIESIWTHQVIQIDVLAPTGATGRAMTQTLHHMTRMNGIICYLYRFPCPVSCCRFEDIRHKMESESILYHSTIFRIFILVMIVRNFPFLRLLRFRFKFPGPWGSYFSGFVNSDCASKPWPQHPAQAQPDISLRGLRARNLMELADVATFIWCKLWQLGQELVPEFLSKLLLSHCG